MLKNNKNAIFEVIGSKNLKDIKQNRVDIKQNGGNVAQTPL